MNELLVQLVPMVVVAVAGYWYRHSQGDQGGGVVPPPPAPAPSVPGRGPESAFAAIVAEILADRDKNGVIDLIDAWRAKQGQPTQPAK